MKKIFYGLLVGVFLASPMAGFALNINQQALNENINKAKNQAENSLFTFTTCEQQAKGFLKIIDTMVGVMNEAEKEVSAQSSNLNAEQKTQVVKSLDTLEATLTSCKAEIQKVYDPAKQQCSETALKSAYTACAQNVKKNTQIFLSEINDIAIKALGQYLVKVDTFLTAQSDYAKTCADTQAKKDQEANIAKARTTYNSLKKLYDTTLSKEDYVPTKEVTMQTSKYVSDLSKNVAKIYEDRDEMDSCTSSVNSNTNTNTNGGSAAE